MGKQLKTDPRYTKDYLDSEKPVHISARLSGTIAILWQEMEERFEISSSELLRECIRFRAAVADMECNNQIDDNVRLKELMEFLKLEKPKC